MLRLYKSTKKDGEGMYGNVKRCASGALERKPANHKYQWITWAYSQFVRLLRSLEVYMLAMAIAYGALIAALIAFHVAALTWHYISEFFASLKHGGDSLDSQQDLWDHAI